MPTRLSDKAHLPFKSSNKQRRQALHIKRKRAKDTTRRNERFGRKKEESRDHSLREARLKRNVPHSLDKKRVWDETNDDVENGGLGLSVDVERIKRQRLEDEQALAEDEDDAKIDEEMVEEALENGEYQASEDDMDDDADSMLEETDDEDLGEVESSNKDTMPFKKPSLPSKLSRAASPTQSTTSTNLSLAPEALASRFPTLFAEPTGPPKILITTSINSTLHDQAKSLTNLFPYSFYVSKSRGLLCLSAPKLTSNRQVPRSKHRFSFKFSIREICQFASNRDYTSVMVLEEDHKRPSALNVYHLPSGPSFRFTISNWLDANRVPNHGRPTDHIPELILNGFKTPLGLLTAHLFRSLFPHQPEIQGRQVITLHNQRDYM